MTLHPSLLAAPLVALGLSAYSGLAAEPPAAAATSNYMQPHIAHAPYGSACAMTALL
ncbi:MAG TPA: hypothetical protein VGF96_18470 [Terracidiphilus sp.]